MISGGMIDREEFAGGWAMGALFGKAHYFDKFFIPDCGALAFPRFHIGDWIACKRCVAKRGQPTIQQREHGRNAEAELLLLRATESSWDGAR
jgi:hypothetical protein